MQPVFRLLTALMGLALCLLASTAWSTPVTTHPRLWITQQDLPRLRAWATPGNPMWTQGLQKAISRAVGIYNSDFFPGGQPNPTWPDSGGVTWPGKVTEQYAVLFAFASLIDPDPAARPVHAQRARNLLMYAIAEAAKGHLAEAPFRDPAFATYDRGRVYFEGFPLTVDWIYDALDANGNPILSAQDKATIRDVFMQWAADCNTGNANSMARPEWVDPPAQATLLADPVRLRQAGNNYFSGRTRNLTLLSLAMDAADDPPLDAQLPAMQRGNTLRSYRTSALDTWLLTQYALYESPEILSNTLGAQYANLGQASGGLSAEGFLYGECLSFVRSSLLGLATAGYHDTGLAGPQSGLIDSAYWERHVDTFIQSLTPATWVPVAWMGEVYGAAAFGDMHRAYVDSTHFDVFGQIGLHAYNTGNTELLNKVRWVAVNAIAGGKAGLYQRAVPVDGNVIGTTAILHYMLFDPNDPLALDPPDPRPALPLWFHDVGLGRIVSRTDWSANATLFDYKCSWLTINHQNGDCNQFELYRNGEWLTKEHSNYDIWGLGMTSDYHNTLSLQNDQPARLPWGQTLVDRGSQWTNGGSDGDPSATISQASGYIFAQGDATNLYNHPAYNPADAALDIVHASRSMLWLKPDLVVTYDRATSRTADRFKRYNLNFVNAPVVNGRSAHMVTPNGQNVYLQSLLPAGATLTVSAAEPMNTVAELEPTQWRLVIEDPKRPTDVRFLTVLQGADANQPMAVATRIQSGDGRFEGVHLANIAVLFPVALGAPATGVSYHVAAGIDTHIVTGLAPDAGYDLQTQAGANGVSVTVVPGSAYTTDSAGVLAANPTGKVGWLTPAVATIGAAGGNGSVSVSALGQAHWSAVSDSPWLTLTGTSHGSGDGRVDYAVAVNSAATDRTGTLTVGGRTHTVVQKGIVCQPSLSGTSAAAAASGAIGNVGVSADPGCAWSAASEVSWITLTGGAAGSGNGSVAYNVAANPGSATRSGALVIAGQRFTITQAGSGGGGSTDDCTVTVDLVRKLMTAASSTKGLVITAPAGCAWQVVSSAPWLTVTPASGQGNAVVSFTAAANSDPQQRTATLSVAGRVVEVIQAGNTGNGCIYALGSGSQPLFPAQAALGREGGTGSVPVSAPGGCGWSASSNAPWITLTSGASASGNGTVGYSVAANATGKARTGTLSIAGQTFTVVQQYKNCTYGLNIARKLMTVGASTRKVTVTTPAGCTWAASASEPWLTALPAKGKGGATVSFSAAANAGTLARNALLTIGGQDLLVAQAGSGGKGCIYAFGSDAQPQFPSRVTSAQAGGAGEVPVSAAGSCGWKATSNVPWVTITAGGSGQGSGTVRYSVAANTTGAARSGTLSIAGLLFTIEQP